MVGKHLQPLFSILSHKYELHLKSSYLVELNLCIFKLLWEVPERPMRIVAAYSMGRPYWSLCIYHNASIPFKGTQSWAYKHLISGNGKLAYVMQKLFFLKFFNKIFLSPTIRIFHLRKYKFFSEYCFRVLQLWKTLDVIIFIIQTNA